MRLIEGQLKRPNGISLGKGYLEFIASTSYGSILEGTIATETVEEDGLYTVSLNECSYLVYFYQDFTEKIFLGKITVKDSPESISLPELLQESNPLISSTIDEYISSKIEEGLSGKQDVGDYLTPEYDQDDTPSTPQDLNLSVIKDPVTDNTTYAIKAIWTPSETLSNVSVVYEVSIVKHDSYDIPTKERVVSSVHFFRGVVIGETYQIEITALAASNSGRKSLGKASGIIKVNPDAVSGIDVSSVTSVTGINYITLFWNPVTNIQSPTYHVFVGDNPTFTPSLDNKFYSGKASTCTFFSPLEIPNSSISYYFIVIVEDRLGTLSSASSALGEYKLLKMDSTKLGRILEEGAIDAQHIANGAIVQDKLAAHAISASKLAVLNLTNLVENENFTITRVNSSNEVEPDYWKYDLVPPLYEDTLNKLSLPPNAIYDNEYLFPCKYGEKFYGSITMSWDSVSGVIDKGFQIVFLDSDKNEIDTGEEFTESTLESEPTTNKEISGFSTAPKNAAYGFLRIRIKATLVPITIKSVVCRHGSAVWIEPGGITAGKIDVLDLFAQEMRLNEGGNIRTGEYTGRSDVDDGSGIIINKEAITLYDAQGNPTTILRKNGTAQFTGDVVGGTFKGNINAGAGTISGGVISGGTIVGATIHSPNKTSIDSSVPGFFMDGSSFAVGDADNYIRYDGVNLKIYKDLASSSNTYVSNSSIYYAQRNLVSRNWSSAPLLSGWDYQFNSGFSVLQTPVTTFDIRTSETNSDLASEHVLGSVSVSHSLNTHQSHGDNIDYGAAYSWMLPNYLNFLRSSYDGLYYNTSDGYIYIKISVWILPQSIGAYPEAYAPILVGGSHPNLIGQYVWDRITLDSITWSLTETF